MKARSYGIAWALTSPLLQDELSKMLCCALALTIKVGQGGARVLHENVQPPPPRTATALSGSSAHFLGAYPVACWDRIG